MIITSAELVSDFVSLSRKALGRYLEDMGLLIYSSAATLHQGNPVMYWGFNPGQDPRAEDETHWKICEAISRFPNQKSSLIDDQDWPNARSGLVEEGGHKKYKCRHEKGKAPYQRGVHHLLEFIGHPGALVANFVFFQTRREGDLGLTKEEVDSCWQVHTFLFKATRARVVITTKGVVNSIRRFGLMNLEELDTRDSGYSNWKMSLFKNEKGPAVIAAPHMSYWGPCVADGKSECALNWIKKSVDRFVR